MPGLRTNWSTAVDLARPCGIRCYYAGLSVPLSIALGIALAVLLSATVRGQSVYRTLFFLPSVVPVVAGSILWMWLLDPQAGLVNHCFRRSASRPRLVQEHG